MILALCLDAVMFICWCCVYLCAIRNGFRYKTWCIPAVSICINFAWELWSVILRLRSGSINYGLMISAVWLLLDVGIAATLVCHYGRGRARLVPLLGLTASVLAGSALLRFEFALAPVAFLSNVLMSALFLRRSYLSASPARRSRLLGVCKLLGTLCATMVEGVLQRQAIPLWAGGVCLLLDVFYLFVVKDFECYEDT